MSRLTSIAAGAAQARTKLNPNHSYTRTVPRRRGGATVDEGRGRGLKRKPARARAEGAFGAPGTETSQLNRAAAANTFNPGDPERAGGGTLGVNPSHGTRASRYAGLPRTRGDEPVPPRPDPRVTGSRPARPGIDRRQGSNRPDGLASARRARKDDDARPVPDRRRAAREPRGQGCRGPGRDCRHRPVEPSAERERVDHEHAPARRRLPDRLSVSAGAAALETAAAALIAEWERR